MNQCPILNKKNRNDDDGDDDADDDDYDGDDHLDKFFADRVLDLKDVKEGVDQSLSNLKLIFEINYS